MLVVATKVHIQTNLMRRSLINFNPVKNPVALQFIYEILTFVR